MMCIYRISVSIGRPTWVASIFSLLWILLLWMWVCQLLTEFLLPVLFGVYPQPELLDLVVILFLVLWPTAILFSSRLDQFVCVPAVRNGSTFSTFSYIFSRSVVISDFAFRSMIYFESVYITMWGMGWGSFFWHMGVRLFQHHLLKTFILSPLNWFCTFVKNPLNICVQVHFWDPLLFHSSLCLSYHQYHTFLISWLSFQNFFSYAGAFAVASKF